MLLATSKTHARIKSALLRKMYVRTARYLHFKGPRGEVVSNER